MNITLRVTAIVFAAYLNPGGVCVAHNELQNWQVTTSFEGGSAELVAINVESGQLHIQPSVKTEQGWPCWWYFKLEGLTVDQNVTLKVTANPQPFRHDSVLRAAWSQPDRAAISTDNVQWSQTAPCERLSGDVAVYRFRAPAKQVWLAWGPPFLPSHAEALLARVAKQESSAVRFELAQTRGGRRVPAIRIGGGSAENPAQYGVWVQARQHAWEAGSSWVGQGFLKWVASDAPAARELRRVATIWFVPIMDIDRVAVGAGGKESVPQDHNRDWSDAPYYRAVSAAQNRILAADSAKRFDLFLDLHNPGAKERQPYFFAPFSPTGIPALRQNTYQHWLDVAAKKITEPMQLDHEYHFTTYVTSEKEHNSMSAVWVRRHTASHVLATTLETAWNTPNSTQAGYQAVGRQLGQAVATFVLSDPRRTPGNSRTSR